MYTLQRLILWQPQTNRAQVVQRIHTKVQRAYVSAINETLLVLGHRLMKVCRSPIVNS